MNNKTKEQISESEYRQRCLLDAIEGSLEAYHLGLITKNGFVSRVQGLFDYYLKLEEEDKMERDANVETILNGSSESAFNTFKGAIISLMAMAHTGTPFFNKRYVSKRLLQLAEAYYQRHLRENGKGGGGYEKARAIRQ